MTDKRTTDHGNKAQSNDSCESSHILLMSDLHLETPRFLPMYTAFHISPKGTRLALLGDIGNVHDERLFAFLDEQLEQFRVVFYVLGNHEPYQPDSSPQRTTHQDARIIMESFEAANATKRQAELDSRGTTSVGQFVFLNRRRFDVSETLTILGCTLFSNIAESQKSTVSLFVSDFCNISDWTVDLHNASHREDLAWLNSQVEAIARTEPHRSIAILTHYSPTTLPEANDPEHLEDCRGVQSAFVTDLSREVCWTSPSVKLWAFGHTHHNCDFIDSETGKRVVANQRGYGREDSFDFDAEKVVTIDETRGKHSGT